MYVCFKAVNGEELLIEVAINESKIGVTVNGYNCRLFNTWTNILVVTLTEPEGGGI